VSGAGPRSLLDARGLRPKRAFGQNFMTDPRIAATIAELCTTPPGGTVLELGAGLGALTLPLAERAGRVLAVERDRDLVPLLEQLVQERGLTERISVVEADAKGLDIEALLRETPRPHVLAGNLPYHLTGPILRATVAARNAVDRVVYLVQLEVADRLAAAPGSEAWGAASVFAQAAYRVGRHAIVRRGAFYPQPRVDSAIIVLDPRPVPLAEETDTFRELVSRAFAQRRKTLRNAWRGVAGLDAARLEQAATHAGIDLQVRGETLEIAAFARMASEVKP
jgi:16S rRNA (adenine1518-N6/adenine1519-N6)-dimethyltransferase